MRKLLFLMISVLSLQSFASEELKQEDNKLVIKTPDREYNHSPDEYINPQISMKNGCTETIECIKMPIFGSESVDKIFGPSTKTFGAPRKISQLPKDNQDHNLTAMTKHKIDPNWYILVNAYTPVNISHTYTASDISETKAKNIIKHEDFQASIFSHIAAKSMIVIWTLDNRQSESNVMEDETVRISKHYTYNGYNKYSGQLIHKFVLTHHLFIHNLDKIEINIKNVSNSECTEINFDQTLSNKLINLIAKNSQLYEQSQTPRMLPEGLQESIHVARLFYNSQYQQPIQL